MESITDFNAVGCKQPETLALGKRKPSFQLSLGNLKFAKLFIKVLYASIMARNAMCHRWSLFRQFKWYYNFCDVISERGYNYMATKTLMYFTMFVRSTSSILFIIQSIYISTQLIPKHSVSKHARRAMFIQLLYQSGQLRKQYVKRKKIRFQF